MYSLVARPPPPSLVPRQAIIASKTVHFGKAHFAPLSAAEAFYLATAGGADALGMREETGTFTAGLWFDALLVDPLVPGSPFDVFEADATEDVVSKFFFLGDDRNIVRIWVGGADVSAAAKEHLPPQPCAA